MEITTDLIELLLNAVYDASDKMMEVYRSDFSAERKEDHTPVTLADKKSSKIICKALTQTNTLIVSEEEKLPSWTERKSARRIWLVDPLDGTKEFIRKNGEFSINIALVEDGVPVFGCIASPVKKEIILGGEIIGAFQFSYGAKNPFDKKYSVQRLREKRKRGLIFSRSHFTNDVNILITKLEERYGSLKLVKKGSALKFFDLVTGAVDFYPRLAPTMEWDIAAGDAIYRSVGGEVLDFTTFDPLQYNKESLYNPAFIAKPKSLRID